jgi:hypothetical protein
MRKMKMIMEIDRTAYELAKRYLPSLQIQGITDILVEKYLNPASLSTRPATISGLYQRILESAQNAYMKARVIGRSIGGVSKLATVLENFDPNLVLRKYGTAWNTILDEIVTKLSPQGQIRRTTRSLWPHYCQTILSAAVFIQQFETADDFYGWVDFFDQDDRARPSLPMLLSHEIEGFGFALSCDFLKELGYVNFPKPDVHLRDIFTALGLLHDGEEDYQLFKAIVRVAHSANVTPYNADKLFWLIGSGYFYDDLCIGKNGRIGSHKQDFITYARPIMDRIKLKSAR